MPSVTVDIRDVKLSCNLPCRPNSLDRCTLVEPQQFVKQFAPEMITVKRLICDDIRRQCVNNTIEHLCEAPVTSIHSHMVDVWRSWRDPARVDTSTYQKSETYSGSTDLRKSALIPQDFGVWGLKYSPSDTTQRSYHLSGKSKSDKVSDRGFKSNPADYMASLQAVNEGRHMPDDVAIAVCGLYGKTATLAKRIVGAADLVAHIYSISGLIPETDVSRKFVVADLYNVEFLHARTGHEVVRPRLSNPFSLYSGAFNRTALENLREWPNLDVLKNRM
ncbi:hypothetical protein, conserved [Babesia bigemina]|uniref:Uncharacterized protein n=1 Tax=Babesia bigemina TaxID=5866 RepID=A0A061DAF6_BABBI|nr:hypothetical protein, conserved [Babesia bigemina]CDR97533.1 hypothetical protein, conserved [Babesia bigemina]|eukprot:XP_012769719.1 hypothetical protein, conserved [Babesia bigemina]